MTTSRACVIFTVLGLSLTGCHSPTPRLRPRARPQPTPTEAAPAATPAEIPTIRSGTRSDDGPRTVIITSDRFPPDVLELRANDLVEVELARGGRARGRVRSLSPDELTISAEGTSIMTRLEPKDVTSARVVYRANLRRPVETVGEEPKNERETWLERFADREVFSGDARRLWRGRFRANSAMTVLRAFELDSYRWAATTSTKTFFSAGGSETFEAGDQVKVVAISSGTEQRGASDVWLGELFLLLRLRDGQVAKVYTTQALSPSNFERDGLVDFLQTEPVTFVVTHPGTEEEIVSILRVDAKLARAYMRAVERLPDRAAMRRMRAKDDSELLRAEADVRAIYGRLGLTEPQELALPLKIHTRVPVLAGTLRLIDFEREIGLD